MVKLYFLGHTPLHNIGQTVFFPLHSIDVNPEVQNERSAIGLVFAKIATQLINLHSLHSRTRPRSTAPMQTHLPWKHAFDSNVAISMQNADCRRCKRSKEHTNHKFQRNFPSGSFFQRHCCSVCVCGVCVHMRWRKKLDFSS